VSCWNETRGGRKRKGRNIYNTERRKERRRFVVATRRKEKRVLDAAGKKKRKINRAGKKTTGEAGRGGSTTVTGTAVVGREGLAAIVTHRDKKGDGRTFFSAVRRKLTTSKKTGEDTDRGCSQGRKIHGATLPSGWQRLLGKNCPGPDLRGGGPLR